MSFISICWLIVKICACVIVLFLILGFIAKFIAAKRDRKDDEDGRVFPTDD